MAYDVIVIGGGPAGMMAAGTAAGAGARVLLLEKMEQPGRKLRITGKGRCNITNMRPWPEFAEHIHPQANVLKTAFYHFSNLQLRDFLEAEGLATVEEHGMRLFPLSGQAHDVQKTLHGWMTRMGVTLRFHTEAKALWVADGPRPSGPAKIVRGVELADGTRIEAPTVIIATGGLSYPATGSTGDGYRLAAGAGHTCSATFPSLTALMPKNYDGKLKGTTLKNVTLCLYLDGILKQEEMGEMAFTEDGIEGALGFRLSRQAVEALRGGRQVLLRLNLKPAVSREQILTRLQRENPHHAWEQLLRRYLPGMLVTPFLSHCRHLAGWSVHRADQLFVICRVLQEWDFPIVGYGGYGRAVVTAGGIPFKEVNMKTLQSKCCEGLFLAGEVLDMDADTGGYNLQLAFSTGSLAGYGAAQKSRQGSSGDSQ